jgi:hypothetical protein
MKNAANDLFQFLFSIKYRISGLDNTYSITALRNALKNPLNDHAKSRPKSNIMVIAATCL